MNINKLSSITMLFAIILTAGVASAVTLNFDDITVPGGELWADVPLNYGDLTWDTGVLDYYGNYEGMWLVLNDPTYSTPHSGKNYLFNGFGPQDIGITFNTPVSSVDAWFASAPQSYPDPSPIQMIGYVKGTATYFSSLLSLSNDPQNLGISGNDIDRIVIHGARAGWYSMDDLTYDSSAAAVPEPSTFALFGFGIAGVAFLKRKIKA